MRAILGRWGSPSALARIKVRSNVVGVGVGVGADEGWG